MAVLITAAQRNERSVFEALMEAVAVKRAGWGRPRVRLDRMVGDKGYSGKKNHEASHLTKRIPCQRPFDFPAAANAATAARAFPPPCPQRRRVGAGAAAPAAAAEAACRAS